MPEGVEVKLSADIIGPLVKGQTVLSADPSPNGRYGGGNLPEGFMAFYDSIVDRNVTITDVQVKGKFMYWTFSNGWYLFNTFGMTGQWSPTAGKHPCFSFVLNAHLTMTFNDPRHFGTIKFTNKRDELMKKLSELGWDPLARQFDEYRAFLTSRVTSSKKCIADLLMDQGIFAGVGNYIRAEALYDAGISPRRLGNMLSNKEVEILCESIVRVMKDSYAHQGATILTYKDAYGAEGKYSSCFKVYGKKLDPKGHQVIKENSPDGRAIHWCPSVQA